MTQPIATYPYEPNHNQLGSTSSTDIMTSQQQLPINSNNFDINSVIGSEGYYAQQVPPQQTVANSNGISTTQQLNSITSSSSNEVVNTSVQQGVTSQPNQQQGDAMQTTQQQVFHVGNSLNQNYNVDHYGQQRMQAGLYGNFGAELTTLQPPTRVECY